MSVQPMQHSVQTTNLADILERVLDKGIVVAGDIRVSVAGVELLTVKLRLLVASIDKAMEIGINWWESDATLSSRAQHLEDENRELKARLEKVHSESESAARVAASI